MPSLSPLLLVPIWRLPCVTTTPFSRSTRGGNLVEYWLSGSFPVYHCPLSTLASSFLPQYNLSTLQFEAFETRRNECKTLREKKVESIYILSEKEEEEQLGGVWGWGSSASKQEAPPPSSLLPSSRLHSNHSCRLQSSLHTWVRLTIQLTWKKLSKQCQQQNVKIRFRERKLTNLEAMLVTKLYRVTQELT